MADTIGKLNPFLYRGYYFDAETGLYYLNSRYYDAQTGRFLNADTYMSTAQGLNGANMFAYCGNSPISRLDLNGQFFVFGFDVLFGSDAITAPRDVVDFNPFSGISIPMAPAVPTLPIYGPIPTQLYDFSRSSVSGASDKSSVNTQRKTRNPNPIAKRKYYSTRKEAE